MLADCGGDVIGGLCHQDLDGLLDGQALPGFEAELGGRALGGGLGHGDAGRERQAAGAHLVEDHKQRHHLGQGGGVAFGIGALGVEHAAGVGIDHHGCSLGGSGRRPRHG